MLIDLKKAMKKHRMDIHGVVHVGAHLGEEHAAYRSCGITDVLWIEGNPSVCDALKSRFARIGTYKIVEGVVSDKSGKTMTFHLANNDQCSSLLELGTHLDAHPEVEYVGQMEVETTTIDDIVWDEWLSGDYSYRNFLNLDIQGAELLALEGAPTTLGDVDYIYTEVNVEELYEGCCLLEDLDAFLDGFERVEFALTIHGWGDALYMRQP